MGEGERTKNFVSLPEECRPGPRDGGRGGVGFSAVNSLFSFSFRYHLHIVECMSWKSAA